MTEAVSSAVVGGVMGTVMVNPIVGYATAVGVNASVDELQKYIARIRQNAEQDAILTTVADMQPGEVESWEIVHKIPMFDNEHGTIQVTRDIATPLTDCKEVLFTMEKGKPPKMRQAPYITTACQDDGRWKWAETEPAVNRWSDFQHISH